MSYARDRGGGLVDESFECGKFRAHLWLRPNSLGEPQHVDLDRGEIPADIVMQLARDACPFLFLGRLEMRAELAKARARVNQLELVLFAARNVRHEAFPGRLAFGEPPRTQADVDPFGHSAD